MISPILSGTINWNIPLDSNMADLQSQLTALYGLVRPVNAVGDGIADDKPAIQAALNAAPAGSQVALEARVYLINSQLVVPPFVALAGPHGNRTDNVQLSAVIKTSASFSDSAAIRFLDQEEGGYATANEGVRLERLTLDGSASSGSVDGVRATGRVHGAVLDRVAIQRFPRRAVSCETYTRADTSVVHPYSWNLWNCIAWQTASHGFYLGNQQTDSTLLNCEALGCGGDGFFLVACQNSQVTSCRAEFCSNGFHLSGSWGTGQGSGGAILTGCSTDRNTLNGVLIDSTGSATHLINGLTCRRDGKNGNAGGGGYAGLNVSSATTPVVVSSVTCYPGVDDDGTGTNSPQYGATFSGNTAVVVQGGYLHGATAGWADGGSNTILRRSPNVLTASGSTASPTRDASTPWNTNGPGTTALSTADQAAMVITNTQANTGLSLIDVTGSAAASRMLDGQVTGDSTRRFDLTVGGSMAWGSGAATRDVSMFRGAANRIDLSTGDFRIGTIGRGLQVAEGSNAKSGAVVLVAGAATVANTAVTATSRIQLTSQADGGTPGWLRVSARVAGTSFTITSSSGTDTSNVAYLLIEP